MVREYVLAIWNKICEFFNGPMWKVEPTKVNGDAVKGSREG